MPRITKLALLGAALIFAGCSSKDDTPTAPVVPNPSNLRAVVNANLSVRLTWDDNSPNESGFRVDRAPAGGNNYTHLPNLPPNTETFTDTGLVEGTVYDYKVMAFSGATYSPSDILPVAIPLKTPFGFMGERLSTSSVRLFWTDISAVETGYQIEYKVRNVGDFQLLTDLEADEQEFIAEGLSSRTVFQFRIRAVKDTVGSNWAGPVSVETRDYTPNPPSDLAATTSIVRPNAVTLRWTVNSGNEDGFIIDMSLAQNSGWAPVDTTLPTMDNAVVTGLDVETVYFFRVYAFNDSGRSAFSNVVAIEVPGPPNAPSDLTANAPDYRGVDLSWVDNSRNEGTFFIERRPSTNPNWARIASVDTNRTSYFDNTTTQNLTYVYRLQAGNSAGTSPYSNEAEVTIPDGPPAGPVSLSATVLDVNKIILAWNDIANNEDAYFIERKIHSEADYAMIAILDAGANLYTDTTLAPDTPYDFRVYCTNANGQSPYSNVATARTMSLTVFTDSFETYLTNNPPGNPWTVTVAGSSTVQTINGDAHEGEKCAQFSDGSSDATAYAALSITHRRARLGLFEAWIKLAPNGYFGIQTMGGPTGIYFFQLQFDPDGRILCRNGRGNAFQYGTGSWTPNQWMHAMVEFNVDSNLYSFRLDDQLIAENFEMQDTVQLSIDRTRFITFTGAAINFARVDDPAITLTPPEGMRSSPLPPRRRLDGPVDFVREEIVPITVK